MKLSIGDKAPEFKLEDQNGNLFNLKDHIGKDNILIYFYPKDETPGCTKEACSFQDNLSEFTSLDCTVVGISGDSLKSHKRFAKKHDLTFSILSDRKNKVRKQYGVKPVIPGVLPGRKTYLVDKKGYITHITEYQFKPLLHIKEALSILKDGN
jgi:peroxiredoxin Q/BCP